METKLRNVYVYLLFIRLIKYIEITISMHHVAKCIALNYDERHCESDDEYDVEGINVVIYSFFFLFFLILILSDGV